MKEFLLPQIRKRFSDKWLLLLCDYPQSHRITEEFQKWLTEQQIYFLPFPHNTSTLLDPLDRKVFGVVKKNRQKLLDLVSTVHGSHRPLALNLETQEIHTSTSMVPVLQRACGFEGKLTDRTQVLLVEHIFSQYIEPKPSLIMEAFQLAGIHPLNPRVVLDRCKSRVSHPPATGILPAASPDATRTVSSDVDRIAAIVADSTLSPISKMREMSAVTSTSLTPLKLLRSQLNEGACSALLPGQVRADRAAPVPSQRRRKSAEALTLGELADFLTSNPSKSGKKRKVPASLAVETDSDDSSSDDGVKIILD